MANGTGQSIPSNPSAVNDPVRRRGRRVRGTGAEHETGSAEGTRNAEPALSGPDPAYTTDEMMALPPKEIMEYIGKRFADIRSLKGAGGGKARAWKELQELIARSLGKLVPEITSMDQGVKMLMDIEKFLQEDGSEGADPMEELADFLSGGL